VEKDSVNHFDFKGLLTKQYDEILNDDAFQIKYFRYLSLNKFTSSKKLVLPGEIFRIHDEDPYQYMHRVNNWINSNIKYQTGITTTFTTIDEILDIKAGVCQDQAHLFIAIMRANQIPARYVSGYLSQGPSFNGTLAMHAWAEAFLPGNDWIGFDPSNNILSGVNHIKVGHGLDYTDCMPIRGILVANGAGTTEYKVKITEQQNQ
jgi:transglutaminase-like putative cysteine protease